MSDGLGLANVTHCACTANHNSGRCRYRDCRCLHAAIASDGKNSFYFNGQPNAPTLRLSVGDQLKITYINDLPAKAKESCAITPCMDMTNLHFHGLAVSPVAPQDDGHYGLHRPRNQGHVRLSLPSSQSRRQGDDGEDSL